MDIPHFLPQFGISAKQQHALYIYNFSFNSCTLKSFVLASEEEVPTKYVKEIIFNGIFHC